MERIDNSHTGCVVGNNVAMKQLYTGKRYLPTKETFSWLPQKLAKNSWLTFFPDGEPRLQLLELKRRKQEKADVLKGLRMWVWQLVMCQSCCDCA
jgi:hypothetical protein